MSIKKAAVLVFIALLAIPTTVMAKIYKCADGSGSVTYSQYACEVGEGVSVTVDKAPSGLPTHAPGLRPAELRRLSDTERRNNMKTHRAKSKKRAEVLDSKFKAIDAKTSARLCSIYKKRLKRTRDELRAGYSASKGLVLNRAKKDYQANVSEYC